MDAAATNVFALAELFPTVRPFQLLLMEPPPIHTWPPFVVMLLPSLQKIIPPLVLSASDQSIVFKAEPEAVTALPAFIITSALALKVSFLFAESVAVIF